MRRPILIVISIFIAISAVFAFQAQTPPQTAAKPALDGQKLVDDFITRLNVLGKWYLTVDGKEMGREELVNSMMELYAPDAIAEVPPHDEEQIGPVMLRGTANIRKWVDNISRTQVKLLYTTPLPWGGLGVSFEMIAAWSRREDRRKFTGPGVVFLQYNADGKIEKLRLYVTEISEVTAL